MTPLQRHRCMSSIKSVDTKPEMLVRQWIWREGFRYRLHVKYLPGTPDIVIRKIKTVIFINGCFWHGHILGECYRPAKSNVEFWATKIQKNRERDICNYNTLKSQGWNVLVVWECQLTKKRRQDTFSVSHLLFLLPNVSTHILPRLYDKVQPLRIPELSDVQLRPLPHT